MSTPNKDDVEITTGTEDNEVDDNETMTSKQHIDIEDSVDSQGKLMNQLPAYDRLLNAKIMVQAEEGQVSGKVIKQAFGLDGKVAGNYDENPYLNLIMYEVELVDGRIKEYRVNIIAEKMLTQVDSDFFSQTLMEGIIDYKHDDLIATPKAEKYITTGSGQRRLWKTTAGWKLLVKWKDESESWVKLYELKESHPVETAEFAKSRGIDDEAAFIWWVPHTLRKRNAIILAVKMRLQKTTHKYGIEIPTSVEHAMEINQKNGNTMWRDALALEMFNVGVAFEILEEDQPAPAGWKKASRHLIWDVKMDFTRKARWVLLKNSSSLFSGSPTLRGSSALLTLLVSFLKITCLHVSFTAYENFYKLSKKHCLLGLTFHFSIFRMSECRNPTIKHIFTYTMISPFISTYVTDLFLVIFFT